jgi:hypothetical protein
MPDQHIPALSSSPIVAVLQAPLPATGFGHYRVTHRCALIATQAAGSRLFTIRNSHLSNLLVITRLIAKWIQTGNHTATIEDSLDVFRATGFTVSDTTDTVTPAAVAKRTTMPAAPGAAEIRGVTIAGKNAGMTGGTMTLDTAPNAALAQLFLATLPANQVVDLRLDESDDDNGSHPFVLAPNEGIVMQNRALLGAAAASSLYVDVSWAECVAGAY